MIDNIELHPSLLSHWSQVRVLVPPPLPAISLSAISAPVSLASTYLTSIVWVFFILTVGLVRSGQRGSSFLRLLISALAETQRPVRSFAGLLVMILGVVYVLVLGVTTALA